MNLLRLDVEPMPAPRPRARAVRLKNGKTFVSIYNPSEYMKWKEAAAEKLRVFAPIYTLDSPLRLTVLFNLTRPKTTKLAAPKPDIDNYIKGFLDAMTDAKWWVDDTQVIQISAEKAWALPGATGFIHFNVQEIT
jgi:Holliday junction resolvase RusA-like endonuclease